MSPAPAPAAVKLIRPAIYAGVLVCLLGAALVAEKLEFGLPLVAEIILLATGVAILVFGLLASLSWRGLQAAMANEAAGNAPLPCDDDDDDEDD
ncbi:hypothetical protein [Maricaulis salignorans]|uniref:Uncharacterized protein n=1 Tax=Maricaulis salignorans TaxID=144026 RepID=A0A1G9VYF7_9PROT|nr:hypothetical protein [Maricaulis salignorans]SDM77332.1 hypothetical protein SAMN04488568_12149 [Maricaulis salignorans]